MFRVGQHNASVYYDASALQQNLKICHVRKFMVQSSESWAKKQVPCGKFINHQCSSGPTGAPNSKYVVYTTACVYRELSDEARKAEGQ